MSDEATQTNTHQDEPAVVADEPRSAPGPTPAPPQPPIVIRDVQEVITYVHALLRWAGVALPAETHR